MTQDWPGWLDRLEVSVAAQRTALREGRSDSVLPAEAPPELGPLPPALETRVRALLRANDALTAELAAACVASARQVKLVGALQQRTTGASFLDTRG